MVQLNDLDFRLKVKAIVFMLQYAMIVEFTNNVTLLGYKNSLTLLTSADGHVSV